MRVIKILAAVMLLSAANAVAAPITLNATQTQTIAGQDFTFNFLGLAPAAGGGTFVLHARGDYDGAADETLTFDGQRVVTVSVAFPAICRRRRQAVRLLHRPSVARKCRVQRTYALQRRR